MIGNGGFGCPHIGKGGICLPNMPLAAAKMLETSFLLLMFDYPYGFIVILGLGSCLLMCGEQLTHNSLLGSWLATAIRRVVAYLFLSIYVV